MPQQAVFVIVWDPEVVSPEDYADLVTAFGDLVRASGGLGIERLSSKHFFVKEPPASMMNYKEASPSDAC